MGRRREGKKQGELYLCFLPVDSLSPELSRLKLQGVTSPLLGWSFVVSYHVVHKLAHTSLASQGDWKCAGPALLLLC